MTDNRASEPTAEQILVDEWIRQADRAKSMTGMDAIWFPDAEETLAVLRANGLLSEGTPSEEHPEFCYCGQILKREDKIDFYTLKCPKLQCGGFRMVPKRSAGVASQEVIDDAADEQDDLRLHMLAPQEPSREIVSEPAISALAAEVSTDLNTLTDYLREHHIRITYREDAS